MTLCQLASNAPTMGLFFAAAGLFLNAWQFARTRRSTTLQHIQEFLKVVNEREAALSAARGDDEKFRHALVEYLNFLEVYSAAACNKLFMGVARELVVDKLMDAIVILESVTELHPHISGSVTSEVTYKYLRLFMRKNRRELDGRRQAARKVDAQ